MTSSALSPHSGDPADVIRAAGLRVTDSRRAVVSALRQRPHASADEVFRLVRQALAQTSVQSVYNALTDFVAAGLVRRIEPAGRPGLFELRVDDNHHHLVCTACGCVTDVDCAVGHAPCLTPSDAHGFTVHTAEITYWGLCPACSAESSASPVPPAPTTLAPQEGRP